MMSRSSAEERAIPRAMGVAIVGAGIGGMQAAFLLAETGRRVALIERAPWIGGSMHLLDNTFPTDSCGLCWLETGRSPGYCPTFECERHPLIDLHVSSRLERVEGQAGNFRLTLRQAPRPVRAELCDGCGLCETVCPIEGPSPYEGPLAPQKAIHRPPPRAVPAAYVIDADLCTRCGRCVEVCPTGAIDLDAKPASLMLEAGAIIASPGFSPFPAERKGEYGYGIHDNVITNLQFERLTSYSGSTGGRLLRPSDGRPARKIAFISCVGSRDSTVGREYCSSICCMITAKQATIARQLDPRAECTVFFMDLRASGRGYDRYLEARTAGPGIRYERCHVSTVKQRMQSRDLLIEYVSNRGVRREERFDMVVLGAGFGPPEDAPALAASLGINLDHYGFAREDQPGMAESSRPGIMVIGAFREPKDIPETVVDASEAAALAAALVPPIDPPAGGEPELTGRPGLEEEPPRVGLFLYRQDGLGPTRQDEDALATLAERVRGPSDLGCVQVVPSLATEAGQHAVVQAAQASHLNRLMVASTGSRLDPRCEQGVRRVLGILGLPESALLEIDLHATAAGGQLGKDAGLRGATTAIRMAWAGLRYRPLSSRGTLAGPRDGAGQRPKGRVAVIGGGPAGLAAAGMLAELGHEVTLVEREPQLGGHAAGRDGIPHEASPREWEHVTTEEDGRTWGPGGPSSHDTAQPLVGWATARSRKWNDTAREWARVTGERLRGLEHVTIYTGATVKAVGGQDGHYAIHLLADGAETTLRTDALILATGGEQAPTGDYGYGTDAHIVTQTELEGMLRAPGAWTQDVRSIVMIQCVGSRDETHPYCSRVCCSQAVHNALRLKRLVPEMDVVILYREMRTPGLDELVYLEARRTGVLFIRYDLSHLPVVRADGEGALWVQVHDPTARQRVDIDADLLVLSVGMEPRDEGAWLDPLGIERDADGFLKPVHEKLRPLNLHQPGIFACGAALGPCYFDEAISQGRGAAMQAALYLRREGRKRPVALGVPAVNERLCSGCELCVRACPFGARAIDPETGIALVLESLCEGCGLCATVCPNGATQQRLFEARSMLATIDAALES